MELIIILIASAILIKVFLGTALKLIMMVLHILSLPTIMGLIYAEDFHNIKIFKINNPPKNGVVKLIFNLFASFITIIFLLSIKSIILSAQSAETIVQNLIAGQIISFTCSIGIIFSVVVIYGINYFAEKNTEDSFTKIDKIDFKGLF